MTWLNACAPPDLAYAISNSPNGRASARQASYHRSWLAFHGTTCRVAYDPSWRDKKRAIEPLGHSTAVLPLSRRPTSLTIRVLPKPPDHRPRRRRTEVGPTTPSRLRPLWKRHSTAALFPFDPG